MMKIFGLETPISLRVRNLRSHTYRCENQDFVSRTHLIYGIKMVIGVANQTTFSHLSVRGPCV
jgi:hypothetical protein